MKKTLAMLCLTALALVSLVGCGEKKGGSTVSGRPKSEMSEKKKTPLSDLMDASLAKIREMVDSNTVVGQPITTPDGVTLIPVSRLSFGFGAGGSDYGKQPTPNFGGGAGAGVKVDPVAFLVVKDGITRVMPVAMPAMTTADRVLELVPEVMDRVENYIDKKKANTDF